MYRFNMMSDVSNLWSTAAYASRYMAKEEPALEALAKQPTLLDKYQERIDNVQINMLKALARKEGKAKEAQIDMMNNIAAGSKELLDKLKKDPKSVIQMTDIKDELGLGKDVPVDPNAPEQTAPAQGEGISYNDYMAALAKEGLIDPTTTVNPLNYDEGKDESAIKIHEGKVDKTIKKVEKRSRLGSGQTKSSPQRAQEATKSKGQTRQALKDALDGKVERKVEDDNDFENYVDKDFNKWFETYVVNEQEF